MADINTQIRGIKDEIDCVRDQIGTALVILESHQTLIDNNIIHDPDLIPIARQILTDTQKDFGKLLENMQEILQHINSRKEL